MPIYRRRTRNSWYDSLPTYDARGILITQKENRPPDPKTFDADKFEGNFIEMSDDLVFAKVPKIEHRIFIRQPDERHRTAYVEFIADRWYDREAGQSRNTKVIIGTDYSAVYPGMMKVNDHYYDYFNNRGKLFNDPLQKRREQEEKEQKEQEKEAEPPEETGEPVEPETEVPEKPEESETPKPGQRETSPLSHEVGQRETSPVSQERTMDEIREDLLKKEKALEEKIREAEAERQRLKELRVEAEEALKEADEARRNLDSVRMVRIVQMKEAEKQHMNYLQSLLDNYSSAVQDQAKRKPDSFMTQNQIRTINRILIELKTLFEDSDAGEYLELGVEPRQDGDQFIPGTTYGEMNLMLSAYNYALERYRYNELYEK